MPIEDIPLLRRFVVPYKPLPDLDAVKKNAQTQTADGITVSVAVLNVQESHRFFGVPMARRGIQPVWVRIDNQSSEIFRLSLLAIDPNYYSPLEAAAANHFSSGRRLLGFGLLAFWFLPLLILLPFKLIGAWRANKKIDAFFQQYAFRLRPIEPGATSEGFVFTHLDAGNKVVHVRLFGFPDSKEFLFTIPVPGLKADYLRHKSVELNLPTEFEECDGPTIRKRLAEMPRATTNRNGTREGDPVNLVVVGDFMSLLSAFGGRWDETETITLETCWKTFRAFLTGWEYRYSPVSALYLFGRPQDFALQRIRQSINERLHLRLWATRLRFQGKPVWIGQISRDIGVRFTWRTWNLTTHRIDPDVDEARDYVIEDMLQSERLEIAAYIDGVGACESTAPRHNLTGDHYFTDGKRTAVVVSETRCAPKFIEW